MQASRASTRALKALATATSKQQIRPLSITGSTTFSSLLTSDKPPVSKTAASNNTPRLPASATIPVPEASETGSKVRHFNTSRSLKAVGDSSTIDFMFIPDFDPDTNSAPVKLRVPIIPWAVPSEAAKAEFTEAEEPVMTPTIHTVSGDGTNIHAASAMSDMTDSNHFDYQGLATDAVSKLSKPVEEGSGMVRQILSGLVDDILGPKAGGAAKA